MDNKFRSGLAPFLRSVLKTLGESKARLPAPWVTPPPTAAGTRSSAPCLRSAYPLRYADRRQRRSTALADVRRPLGVLRTLLMLLCLTGTFSCEMLSDLGLMGGKKSVVPQMKKQAKQMRTQAEDMNQVAEQLKEEADAMKKVAAKKKKEAEKTQKQADQLKKQAEQIDKQAEQMSNQ
jgi:hypothetical protein